jgi:hypothetical protein
MKPNKLTCSAYRDFTGKKGSNTVASILMKYRFEKNWRIKENTGKRPTIAMDNCGGQNKNNHVLHLAPYLVEMGFSHEVEFVFYIRGPTKNACNQLFNQMKLRYHTQDIFTSDHALEVLDKQDNVMAVDAAEEIFKNYWKFLDKHYNNFKTGSIKKYIFRVNDHDSSLGMTCATHESTPEVIQPMLKK